MVFQVTLGEKQYNHLLNGLSSEGSYSFDIRPDRNNLRVYRTGNVIRLFEAMASEFHPIKDPHGNETHHKRILHKPTGRELRVVVDTVEPSTSEGYLKVTIKEDK